VDANPVALPYYNASNPAQPYSGPNNSGTAQNTTRKGTIVLTAKAGVAAATGTQITPSADSGNVGLWVVTVANGQTQIIAGNIAQVSGAPFITNTLTMLAPLASPAFTGTPTAPTPAVGDESTKLATTAFVLAQLLNYTTPPQFDNDTSLATTEFVQRALGNDSNARAISAATTLDNTYLGGFTQLAGTTYPVNLPLSANCAKGSRLKLLAFGAGPYTLTPQGAEDIITPANGTLATLALVQGDTVILESFGAGHWYIVGGSAALKYASGAFGTSSGANDYQRLPSGKILQWGVFMASVAGMSTTFPFAFPNHCRGVWLQLYNQQSTVNVTATTLTGFTATTTAGTPSGFFWAVGD